MFTEAEGEKAVKIARRVIEVHVKAEQPVNIEFPPVFDQKGGVFVTLNKYPSGDLRGCIGYPEPVLKLKEALPQAAMSASRDPRFMPLRPDELDGIVVEVTLLTPPEEVEYDDPSELPGKISCGRDGLIISLGFNSGLLLPQVPVEYDWSEEEFLDHTCMKAGLPRDSWRQGNCTVKSFQGTIYAEVEPVGKVERRGF